MPKGQPAVTKTTAIGEVLSSSITGLVAESWQSQGEDGMPTTYRPSFGSLLKVDCEDELAIFAVVYNIITGPADSNHQPAPLAMTREQLRLEQPQIFALLRTEIHAALIGYAHNGIVFPHLPPRPPQVHDFVCPASDAEIRDMTSSFDFLRLIASINAVPPDELLAATVRQAHKARGFDQAYLIAAGQAISHLFRDDYDRLISVLRKLKPPSN